MYVFYSQIVLVYIFSFINRICKEKNFKGMNLFWSVLVLLSLILVAGLSTGIGDSGMYKHSYNLIVQNGVTINFTGEFGWVIFNAILTQISTNPQTLMIAAALITHSLNYIVFYKYSSYLELQTYLYLTSGYYLVTMNGMRQCLAAALLCLASKLIIKGSFKKYLIIVLIVSTVHSSAVIMIPVYFIVRQEAWSKKVIIFIGMATVGVFGYTYLEDIFFRLIQSTSYGHYSNFNEGGSSVIRAVVNIVPVALAYLKREELKKVWPESNVFVNMSIINCIFVTFGIFNWIFNRFTLYFQLYNFILIPYLIKHCFKGKEKRLIYIGVLLCYFIFFYREQVIGLGLQYRSEYLNVNNIFYDTIAN